MILSPVHVTRPADDIKQKHSRKIPDDLHSVRYVFVFTVQSSEKDSRQKIFLARSDREKKPHQKITLLTALKVQKKPATKNHVLKPIKKPQKISIYSRSPCSVSIE